MFVPKEICQNLLMGLRPVRRWAQTRHRTGIQQDADRAHSLFEEFSELAGVDLTDAAVLELGPGKGTGLMRAARGHVGSYAAFDVEPYLDGGVLEQLGVDYRVDSSGVLPWEDRSMDVVWSHSVLEHVRRPGPLLREVGRVLASGGVHLASIDLQDHYGDRADPASMYGFLQYSDRLWWWMTSNRSSYCNRLRASDWRRLAEEAGFHITAERVVEPNCSLGDLRAVPYLRKLDDRDLLAAGLVVVMRNG